MMPTRAPPPPTARLKSVGEPFVSSPARRSMVTASVTSEGMRIKRPIDVRSAMASSSDDLHSLRRLGILDVLEEPELVTVGILDRERPVAPPLHGQGARDLDALLPELIVVALHILDFDVHLDGPLAVRRCGAGHLLLWA